MTVLNEAGVPDAPLAVEPAPTEYRRTALYVLPNVRTVVAQGSATGSVTITPGAGQPGSVQAQGARVTFTELASGTNAAVTDPTVRVATSQGELSALYGLAYGRQTGVPAAPSLGAGGTAVGIFLGQRPTGGYGVRVLGASTQGGVLTLTAEVRSPGPGSITTQALTSPWTIVRVSGTYREVRVVNAQGQSLPGGAGGGTGQTR